MFKKFSAAAMNIVVTLTVFVATTGVEPFSWLFTYQPEPPAELR